jgi:hypothetical protein
MSEFDLTLDRERLAEVRHGAVVVTTEPAVFRVQGPGALTCLQGLLTNDLVKPGDNSLVYGALLTPKGAVVVDFWVLRQPEVMTLIAPRHGHEASLDLFRRQLPPRLARVTDLTGQSRVAWLLGSRGFQTLAASGVGMPEASGRVARAGRRDRRTHAAAGGALRSNRGSLLYERMLHRTGDGRSPALPRSHQPRIAGPALGRSHPAS